MLAEIVGVKIERQIHKSRQGKEEDEIDDELKVPLLAPRIGELAHFAAPSLPQDEKGDSQTPKLLENPEKIPTSVIAHGEIRRFRDEDVGAFLRGKGGKPSLNHDWDHTRCFFFIASK